MRNWVSQGSWNLKKCNARMSWVWEMRVDHYEVRKKAHKHGQWGMKQNYQVCMEIWNSKFDGNIYSNLEAKFGTIPKVHFGQDMYIILKI